MDGNADRIFSILKFIPGVNILSFFYFMRKAWRECWGGASRAAVAFPGAVCVLLPAAMMFCFPNPSKTEALVILGVIYAAMLGACIYFEKKTLPER